MKNKIISSISLLALLFTSLSVFAWGRRGHQIVGETAALLVSSEPESEFMRNHSYDFGYYSNVPDFIWKRPATYAAERNEHFMDLEVFKRELAKQSELKAPFELSRLEFETKFPDIKPKEGRAFWRVRELNDELTKIGKELRDYPEATGAGRQKIQERWVLTAGVMSHYVGDLGMPLHVSENYDGQMTGQKGIHSYFEDKMVDQLYPDLLSEVNREAKRKWPEFKRKNSQKTVLQLLEELSDRSSKAIPSLLKTDKKIKRELVQKNSQTFRPMIRDRLVDSTLVLAELYRRQLGFKFDDNRFYYIGGEPAHIPTAPSAFPPDVDEKPKEESKKKK